MILSPSQYSESSAYDLLKAAASGHVGIDRRFIRAIVDRGPSVLPELLRFAAEERSSDLVDLDEELIGFFRHFRAPEAVPYLVELVRSQPEDIPDDVVQALVELGEPAVEPLLALYEELDAEDNDIPFLLASLRVRHPRVTALLTDRLTYDPMDAAFCLELYADPATRPALEETLASLGEDDHEVRRAIEEALSRIDTSEPAPLLEPFDIWEPYSEEDTPHFDVLSEAEKLAFLESPEPQYRAGAAASLGKDDISERAAARVLELAENDPDPEVRGECWEALGAWAVDKEPVRQKMRKRVEDTSAAPVERASALVALTSDAEDDFVHDWLLEFYHLPEIRWKALEGMWRSFNPRYVGFFPKHLDDADLNLRREAIWGIGHLRIQAEAGRLRDLFQDDDLRTDALYNYAVAWPGDVARSRARSLLRRIEDWAGGLSIMEAQIVQTGLDERLVSEGMRPVFSISEAEQEADLAAETAQSKTGRNDPCPCGSGKKYKKCCGQ